MRLTGSADRRGAPDLANADAEAIERAAVLENKHHDTRSAAAFDQSPKGFIRLPLRALGEGPALD
jgi:hypothetical protein